MTSLPLGIITGDRITGDTLLYCDVVIVGSGAGGAAMAAELAEAGIEVIILEEGGYHDTESFNTDTLSAIKRLYRDGGASMTIGRPSVMFQEGRVVGGSSVINGAMSWRTPEHILRRWRGDAGVDRILPDDMDPFFARVERRINVAEQALDTVGRDNALLREGAERLGWQVLLNRRNQLHCAGSNNCAFGCPTGAKRSTLLTYIPRALHFGARLYADVRVRRILRRGKRAIGVEARVVRSGGRYGARLTVRAQLVVVACGAVQTPVLVARSGFRSPSGQLGRNLSLHPNAKIVALFPTDVRGWEGVHQAFQVREFQRDGIVMAAVNVPPSILAMTMPYYGDALGEVLSEYHRAVIAGVLVEDTATGRVLRLPGGRAQVAYRLADADIATLKRGVALTCEAMFAAGATKIYLPFEGFGPVTDVDQARRISDLPIERRALEVLTVHLMGSARMGCDRSRHVTDSYGRFHNADRLIISDASLFPTPIGVNPCETILALSTRNAAHIIENKTRYLS
ncbi:MAG: GMC family oxidoreductase [Candidatus Schekmanbacteria bacterium]|nr:GMC family oxidoreductase [Candidatus Schekmanbacteria bacterium]